MLEAPPLPPRSRFLEFNNVRRRGENDSQGLGFKGLQGSEHYKH